MGIIVNTVNDLGTAVGNAAVGPAYGVQCPLHMVKRADGMDKLGTNAANALDYGSETAPLVSECKDLAEGITSADFQAAAFNAGLLALYILPGTTNMKIGIAPAPDALIPSKILALSTAHHQALYYSAATAVAPAQGAVPATHYVEEEEAPFSYQEAGAAGYMKDQEQVQSFEEMYPGTRAAVNSIFGPKGFGFDKDGRDMLTGKDPADADEIINREEPVPPPKEVKKISAKRFLQRIP